MMDEWVWVRANNGGAMQADETGSGGGGEK
jgi:hypothetical protein